MSRLLLFAQWAALVVGLATLTNIGHAADPKPDPPPRVWLSSAFASDPGCLPTVRAITYYRKAYTSSRERMGTTGAPARVWYQNCTTLRRRATMWRDRAHVAARELAAWQHHQYAWQRWLPAKWYRVARCETGVNWSHDSGTYVGAFGIYRAGYADDAARVGNMSWDETVRARGTVPTPREQYDAALSHYRAHGGFSGWGCRGA